MDKIDLIVPWVDGNDPKWLEEKRKYDGSVIDDNSNSSQRYRDWDLMRYFFRGIDKNMPWINKVFFVTWGHVPDWLDVDSPRLRIVKHTDYIPEKYLPTFNSNVIELNYHRIEDLSENFILFNDDCFAVDQVKPEFFFKNGKPCDMLVAKTLVNYDLNAYIWHTVLNDMGIINNLNFAHKKCARTLKIQ
ncbi:stealth family protein [Butyrivibrio sp. VCB2006]|uniref:stealth family protein n=1 Tax=Butyrivibrio sp. VCB2006 TaxID=1280679 RepID=UPI000410C2E1|nr:stealth family protein [Butyrivibrio sp. VCB2006]